MAFPDAMASVARVKNSATSMVARSPWVRAVWARAAAMRVSNGWPVSTAITGGTREAPARSLLSEAASTPRSRKPRVALVAPSR